MVIDIDNIDTVLPNKHVQKTQILNASFTYPTSYEVYTMTIEERVISRQDVQEYRMA